ncbi:MAG: hypothetical protein LH616_19630, partial [Ilumatobacteraceae bacterium]|nr:hypothetical protein [Ilumatobacteraceae bacterium]
MFATARSSGIVIALCLAALPPLTSAQSTTSSPGRGVATSQLATTSQGRMNQFAVAATSNAPVSGVEPVQFSGQAIINSRMVPDPDFGKPTFILLIELAGVTGVGAQSGTRYVLSSQEHSIRPHAANQNVTFIFP